MAAVFYSPSQDKSLFKGDFAVTTAIRIPFLESLIGKDAMAIVTDISVENSENIQYFLTFDDVVSYFYFGSGLGNIVIRGMMFLNCDGVMPGMEKFYETIGEQRGVEQLISIGKVTFKALINNFSTSSSAEPTMTTEFQISLTIIEQKGMSKPVFKNSCS